MKKLTLLIKSDTKKRGKSPDLQLRGTQFKSHHLCHHYSILQASLYKQFLWNSFPAEGFPYKIPTFSLGSKGCPTSWDLFQISSKSQCLNDSCLYEILNSITEKLKPWQRLASKNKYHVEFWGESYSFVFFQQISSWSKPNKTRNNCSYDHDNLQKNIRSMKTEDKKFDVSKEGVRGERFLLYFFVRVVFPVE